jgi:hypothetical protein
LHSLVAGVKSQTKNDFTISGEDTISIEIQSEILNTSAASSEKSEISFEMESQSKRRIIGGVDDERREIREVCPLESVKLPYDLPNLSSPLECARTCNNDKPKICYYHFVAEIYYSVSS